MPTQKWLPFLTKQTVIHNTPDKHKSTFTIEFIENFDIYTIMFP